MLKLKTKEIGSLVYFGEFGINSSIRWKASADDKLQVINDANIANAYTESLGATDSKTKVTITKDMNVINESLKFGFGAEMNLSGSTSLTFGLDYSLGFTSATKSPSDYLGKRTNPATYSYSSNDVSKMPQILKSNAIVLTVGVLF